jgi:DNA mismatch repair protein MutL
LSDIIQLLPDNIANQIAAGEVIQRPASAVKELLENAVDAGATEIKLIIQDAGKALIQVVDNGKGMTESDARMCFERHATSKIKNINDLFSIRTMGFRGEALASIAAVAQVVLKTKRAEDEHGTLLEVENSMVTRQEPCATPNGTSIAMKNLFFNVPARRNFLKSNSVELRHIIEEFVRVALSFPDIFFSLTNNNQEMFHLEKGSLKQRLIQILGNQFASRLVSVQDKTDYLTIRGFVGKPETARKTRGDQYFFVNNRFIKSHYLHHALMNAYQELIPADSFPVYALFIELDPAQVDVNVHPTKQEIKFEDEKIIYAFVQAAVKHALAQFSITPTLDFDLDANIQKLDAVSKPVTKAQEESTASSSLFRTFTQKNQAHFIERKSFDTPAAPFSDRSTPAEKSNFPNNTNPEENYSGVTNRNSSDSGSNAGSSADSNAGSFFPKMPSIDRSTHSEFGVRPSPSSSRSSLPGAESAAGAWSNPALGRFEYETDSYNPSEAANKSSTSIEQNGFVGAERWGIGEDPVCMQLHHCFILVPTQTGFLLVHQQLAHERVLYDRYAAAIRGKAIVSQQLLFPTPLELPLSDALLLQEMIPDLKVLGYLLRETEPNTFIIEGTPGDVKEGNEHQAIENLLEQIKYFSSEIKFSKREKLIRSLATQHAVKAGQALDQSEMKRIVSDLFKCPQANTTASGMPTFMEFRKEQIEKMFLNR